MGWFENTWEVYPHQQTYANLYVTGVRPPWQPASKSYGHTRGWELPATTNNVVTYIYPVMWFRQMQAYVRALLANKPASTDSVDDQVYWSLMLMGAVSQGMWALNVNDLVWCLAYYGNWDYETLGAFKTVEQSEAKQDCVWYPRVDAPRIPPIIAASISPDLLAMNANLVAGKMPVSTPWRTPWEKKPWESMRSSLVEDYTQFWPKAPFLHPPLVFDHIGQVSGYNNRCVAARDGKASNTLRADWWHDWIDRPKSIYCPWATRAHDWLTSQPLTMIARSYSMHDSDHGWRYAKQYVDERATEWFKNIQAGSDSKRKVFAGMWKLLALSYRHPNAAGLAGPDAGKFGFDASLPREKNGYIPTLDDIRWEARMSRGKFRPPFPLFKLVKVDDDSVQREHHVKWDRTFDFAKAYDQGVYDTWGKWFSEIDMPSLIQGLDSVYLAYVAQGYIDQAHKKSDRASNFLVWRKMIVKKDWEKVVEARTKAARGKITRVVLRVVGFVVNIVTLNVQGLVSNIVGTIEDSIDKAKDKGLGVWQVLELQPQGFLRTLKAESGPAGWASFDTASADGATVLENLGNSIQDTVAGVQLWWPKAGSTEPQRTDATPPSKGGPPVALFEQAKEKFDYAAAALWGVAVAAVGYGTWRMLSPAKKANVRRVARKARAKVRRLT